MFFEENLQVSCEMLAALGGAPAFRTQEQILRWMKGIAENKTTIYLAYVGESCDYTNFLAYYESQNSNLKDLNFVSINTNKDDYFLFPFNLNGRLFYLVDMFPPFSNQPNAKSTSLPDFYTPGDITALLTKIVTKEAER